LSQTIVIANKGASSVVPTLAITPLDGAGHPLTGVSVTTVFGSDHGALVVAPGRNGGYDVLVFSGPDRAKVADVAVAVTGTVRATEQSQGAYVTVQTADRNGGPLSKFDRFEQVVLHNPNSAAVSVRTVYIVYDQPSGGASQQAVAVVPVGGLTTVAAGGSVTVPVTGAAQEAVARYSGGPAVSVKTYFSQ